MGDLLLHIPRLLVVDSLLCACKRLIDIFGFISLHDKSIYKSIYS